MCDRPVGGVARWYESGLLELGGRGMGFSDRGRVPVDVLDPDTEEDFAWPQEGTPVRMPLRASLGVLTISTVWVGGQDPSEPLCVCRDEVARSERSALPWSLRGEVKESYRAGRGGTGGRGRWSGMGGSGGRDVSAERL